MRQKSALIRRAVESLESRRLLHGDFDVTFDFQPESSALAPNTIADFGYVYGDRGNGYAFGWNVDSRGIMRDRDKTADQRLDTVAQLQQGGENHWWELEIPNGRYEVTLTAGDSKYLDGEHHIDVEGTRVMYGVQSAKKQFLKATKVVEVSDGRLTVNAEPSGVNSKLISVAVKSVHDPEETLPTVSIIAADDLMYEGGNDTSSKIRFQRVGDTAAALTVDLDWSGSASTKDFRGRPTTVTFLANQNTVDLDLSARNDGIAESEEAAKVRILASNKYKLAPPSTTTIRIRNGPADKSTLTISVTDASAAEGGGNGEILITRSSAQGALKVPVTWGGTASTDDFTAGVIADEGVSFFDHAPSPFTFPDGVSQLRIGIAASDDSIVESTESAILTINGSDDYDLSGSPGGTVNITDNDVAPKSTVTIAATDAAATEGGDTASIRLTRTGGTQTGTLVVPLTWSGSAGSGDLNRPSSVTFSAGASTATITLTATDDANVESDETATATIATDAAYIVGSPAAASVTIHDNDTPGSFSNINWSTTSSPPVVFSETTSAVINNQLYLFGGFNGVFSPQKNVYRFNGTTWTRMNDSPVAFTHVGSTEVDGKVWFAGGYLGNGSGGQIFGTTNVRIYDPSNDTWTNGPSLPSARASGNLQKVDRKLYFFGGEVMNRTSDSTTMWALDLDNQSAGWVAKSSMPMARNHVPAVVSNGKIIVLGGQTGFDGSLVARDDIQIYDVATNTWSVSSKKLPGPRSHTVSATLLYQGKIIMVGGESAHDVPQKNVWAIDPSTLVTTALNNIPTERFSAAMGIVNGKLYVIGGYRGGIATQGYVGTFV